MGLFDSASGKSCQKLGQDCAAQFLLSRPVARHIVVAVYTWRSSRLAGGTEWYNYPSALAQNRLCYLIGMGKGKVSRGFRHGHSDEDGFLFQYIHRGQMWLRLDDRDHRTGPGAAWLVDMSEPVTYGNDGTQAAENWWFTFSGKDIPTLFAELRADREPIFRGLDRARIRSLYDELLALIQRQPPGYEIKSAAVILAILGELAASRMQEREFVTLTGRAPVLSEPVRRGIDYITRFYREPLQLKRIADRVELSLFHFARLFRKEMGVTPNDYLNRYRIEQAKRLLLHSNKPVAQIGTMVGLNDPTYFARMFRRHTGKTPKRFRMRGGK
jgi:AraC-like DNA-binding protein